MAQMTRQDGQNNPPHQDSMSTSPERTSVTRSGGRHNHSKISSENRTQEVEAVSHTADQYDETPAEDIDPTLPESPSSIQHDEMDKQSVAPPAQSQQETEVTPHEGDQEGAENHHPAEDSDCANSEMQTQSYHQTADQIGNDVNTPAVYYGPDHPAVHGRARERRPKTTPRESRRRKTTVWNDSEQMPRKMGQPRNAKQISSKQTKAEEDGLNDTLTVEQKHIADMQSRPTEYYQYFKKTIKELEEVNTRWEARFNALSEEMLSGRDRYQPTTDSHLQNEMTHLRESVRSLAKTVTRSVRDVTDEEFRRALEGKTLTKHIDPSAWNKRNRGAFLQSVIWRVLYDYLFQTPFQLYGDEGMHVGEIWVRLFEGGTVPGLPNSCPPPSQASEKWKSLTGFQLHEKFGKEAPGCKNANRELKKLLGTLCGRVSHELKDGLNGVLEVTAGLATVICQQRCRLELFIPEISEDGYSQGKIQNFDSEELVNDETVIFVVVPCLRKWGNGFGANLDQCEDLEAAQVKCIEG